MNTPLYLLLVMMIHMSLQQVQRTRLEDEITKHVGLLTDSSGATSESSDYIASALDGDLSSSAGIDPVEGVKPRLTAELEGVFCIQTIFVYTEFEIDNPADFVCSESEADCPLSSGEGLSASVERNGELDVGAYKDCESGYLGNAFYVRKDEVGSFLNIYDLAVAGTAAGKLIHSNLINILSISHQNFINMIVVHI